MSFGLSIGDILVCIQIAYRLFAAATSGRKNAPRGLRELEDTLFGLKYSLGHVQRASNTLLPRSYHNAGNVQEQLEFMIHSCHETLEALEKATAKYRNAAKEARDRKALKLPLHREFTSRVKFQWRMFLWDLRAESFSQYQVKIQSHADAINIILNTFILSATDRIEDNDRRQASQFNGEMFHFTPNHYPFTLPRRSSTLPG